MAKKTLRIDIETIPLFFSQEEFEKSPLARVWVGKYCQKIKEWETPRDLYRKKSSLHAEFSKLCCISVGYFVWEEFETKSFAWEDEYEILTEFNNLVNKIGDLRKFWGHNIKQFDLPYIAKRMVILGFLLPEQLNFSEKKPREIDVIDTMEIRKFGRHLSSGLDLMCVSLWIPTPKDNMEWSEVKEMYLSKNIAAIVAYCEADTKATAMCYERIKSWVVRVPPMDIDIETEYHAIKKEHGPHSIALWAWWHFTELSETQITTNGQKKKYIEYFKKFSLRNDKDMELIAEKYKVENLQLFTSPPITHENETI